MSLDKIEARDADVQESEVQDAEKARAEHWAEAAFNEGWRSREARLGPILNSRAEMRKKWLDSNARAAVLDGEIDDH